MKEHLKRYIDESTTSHVRGLRILLEYFYAAERFEPIQAGKALIVSVFGSARSQPGSPAFKQAYELGKKLFHAGFAVVTGASQGVMLAANQGVADAVLTQFQQKKKQDREKLIQSKAYRRYLQQHSLGLRISLPFEEKENSWVGTAATFHYFMVRKFYFATLSQAFVACEGGWGTRDELFEMLTLVQTGKAPLMPILYLTDTSEHFNQDLKFTIEHGFIHPHDARLIDVASKPDEVVKHIKQFYERISRIRYLEKGTIRLELKKSRTAGEEAKLKKIWPKFEAYFSGYHWKGKTLDLLQFSAPSYGYLRDFIEAFNAL